MKSGSAAKTRSTPVTAVRTRAAQLDRQRGEPVLVAESGQQVVAEMPAEPGQLRRHRGLAQADLLGGLADAALLQQRVQRDQQIQVEIGQVHIANVSIRIDTVHHAISSSLMTRPAGILGLSLKEEPDMPALSRWIPRDPEAAIAAAAKRCSNWGRWGADDVHGTLNFLTDAKRREGAALIRRGVSFSLAQSFDANGPQKGWRRRTNPVHTMLDTGVDAERGNQGFPHGIGGADDVIFMPLQASTQWDGLGHIFDHGNAWNGRRAGDVVTSEGDLVTGIQTATGRISGRGVLLDVGRAIGENGELPDGFAITTEHLEQTIAAQGATATVGRGDLLLVRTGRLARARREGWGDYAGGASPGSVVHHRGLAARHARSPGSPPTPGVSRCGRTSSTTPSSRCTRSPSRTSACSSASCGTWTRWPRTARPTASTSSGCPRNPCR